MIKKIIFIILFILLTTVFLSSCDSDSTDLNYVSADLHASNNFLLSFDDENYSQNIDLREGFYSYYDSNLIDSSYVRTTKDGSTKTVEKTKVSNIIFKPITSLNSSDPGNAINTKSINGVSPGKTFKNSNGDLAITNEDYLEFVVFIKSSNSNTSNIYLKEKIDDMGYIDAPTVKFYSLVNFSYKGEEIDKADEPTESIEGSEEVPGYDIHSANSFRMSISNANNDVILFASDEQITSKYDYGLDHGGVFCSQNVNEPKLQAEDFLSVVYYNKINDHIICNSDEKESGSFLAPENDYNYSSSIKTTSLGVLEENQSTKIVVRLWVESWDGDNLGNEIDQAHLNLEFSPNIG